MDEIKCANYVKDVGFGGWDKDNHLVSCGATEDLVKCKESYTADYLNEKLDWILLSN